MKRCFVWFWMLLFVVTLATTGFTTDLKFKYPQEVLDWAKEVKQKVGGQKVTVASIEITAMDAWKKMAPDFEELTGIKVEWYSVELSKLHDRYLLDNAGKTGLFDIMYCSKAFGYSLLEMGAIESLQPWLDNQKAVKSPAWLDYKDFIGPLRYANEDLKGKAFAFPATGECAVMGYRKDLFEELKQPYPKTWQDVLKAAKFFNDKKLKRNNVQVYGIVMRGRPAFGGANFPVPLLGFDWGAKLYDYNSKKVVWNSPEAVASLEFLVDLVKNGHPQISSFSATESISSFAGGNAAMCLETSALVPVVENPKTSVVKDKIHYTAVPMGAKNDYNTISGAGLAMSSQTKNKDAAFAFLAWMLGRANGNIYVDNGGAIVRDSLITKRKNDFPYYEATIKGYEQAQKMLDAGWDAQPKTRWTMAWTNTFAKYGSAAFVGQMTPTQAVKSMQNEFEETMMR